MQEALFLNGVYDDILKEIADAQANVPDLDCYLQPYATGVIKLLSNNPPSPEAPVTLYVSTTESLGMIGYMCKIVGWFDKRELAKKPDLLESMNAHMKQHQPMESQIFLYCDDAQTKKSVNLLVVRELCAVKVPISVTTLIKTRDGKPRRVRPLAGGWSPVYPLPQWVGDKRIVRSATLESLQEELQLETADSRTRTAAERKKRLEAAPKNPAPIQVISKGFRRNADVVVEVMERAVGKCEACKTAAPFLRASDGSPYLEIHHKKPLAQGGEDTVENALAVCPNCHMRFHYGIQDS